MARTHRRRRRAARRNPRFGIHRPTLMYTRGKWYRRPKSRLMKKGTRINPRRRKTTALVPLYGFRGNEPDPRRRYRRNEPDPRRRYHRRRVRRNPQLPLQIDKVAIGGLKIAGGIALGFMGIPVLKKVLPEGMQKYRKFYGVLHIGIGAAGAAFIKNRDLKDLSLIVAGVGVYDLISQNLEFLGLPKITSESKLLGTTAGEDEEEAGDEPGIVGMQADYAPALGSSYDMMGSSYQETGDDIAYGDEGVEID